MPYSFISALIVVSIKLLLLIETMADAMKISFNELELPFKAQGVWETGLMDWLRAATEIVKWQILMYKIHKF